MNMVIRPFSALIKSQIKSSQVPILYCRTFKPPPPRTHDERCKQSKQASTKQASNDLATMMMTTMPARGINGLLGGDGGAL